MRRRNQIDAGEARALAQEEQERQERLDDKGLCFHCEDNPQNPYLSAPVCLDCWNSERWMGCQTKGCPNSGDGSFMQAQFCSIHLANVIHEEYQEYLKLKSDMEEREKKLEDRASDLGIDPRNSSRPPREMTEEQSDFYDDWIQFRYERQEVGRKKAAIESAMKDLDEPFPEGYEIFG